MRFYYDKKLTLDRIAKEKIALNYKTGEYLKFDTAEEAIDYSIWTYPEELLFTTNFSVELEEIKQSDIKNLGNRSKGICMLTSIYTSFKNFFNLTMTDCSNLTKLAVKHRSKIDIFLKIFNKRYKNDTYKLKYSEFNGDLTKLNSKM